MLLLPCCTICLYTKPSGAVGRWKSWRYHSLWSSSYSVWQTWTKSPALHSLTGCDITSKIGTKKAVQKLNLMSYWRNFGVCHTFPHLSLMMQSSTCSRFTDQEAKPRVSLTCGPRFSTIQKEALITICILSAAFTIHALEVHQDPWNVITLKPDDYGCTYDEEQLIPGTSWKTLEPNWPDVCLFLHKLYYGKLSVGLLRPNVWLSVSEKAISHLCKNPL